MARPNEEFLGVVAGHYRSAMLTLMIDLGHRTGLLAAAMIAVSLVALQRPAGSRAP